MIWKKSLIIMAVTLVVILSACSGTSASEQIYNHLEKAVELEETFEKQQNPIVALEQKEQEIYNKIIELSMDEYDKMKELSEEAIANIEKREKKIGLEKESMQASKKEFMKMEDELADLEDKSVRKKADKLNTVMSDRYDAYMKLHEAYSKSLSLEKELYTMLQDKELEQKSLSNHIEELNKAYEKVIETNEKFNELTNKYNELKKDFYEAAEINVKYEDTRNKNDKKEESGKSESAE
ncbi:YkyA family protein [Lentibacillus cibarius]|uniref:Cell-wall binding lipoprotein n=1 Tax=Lentibacillus cibarius TaxID=2583219 RepID=A0A5S3QNB8_9BACI|nr:YkyA family protein [Lentibacillus cibarius]TMN23442.1 hypothetical protein FFL34_16065 [Lentibacillus cibarius]